MKKEFCRKLVDFYKSERTEDKMTVKNATLKDKSGNTIHPITKGVLVINNDSENLGNVEAGAQVNTIEGVQVASSDLTPDSSTKKVNIPVASANTYGVIKAEAKTSSDTQEVKIDATTGKLYTAPGGGGTSASVDNETIRENASDELEVFGIIEQNDGVATKVWTGTYAEYSAIAIKDQDTIYNITDDALPGETIVPGNGLSYDSSTMTLSANDATSSVKGVMKLYNTVGTNTDGTMTQASIKSNFVPSSRFLPNGTVITVGASGKDFTSFTDAIEYIKFKFSDGVVTIQLDAGTYVLPLGYGIPTSNFNFGLLVIKGAGDTTILQRQSTDWAWVPTLNISSADSWGTPVRLESLCIDSKSNKGDSYNTRGLGVESGNCSVKNITIKNTSSGGMYSNGGITTIVGSITITNTAYALEVDGGILKTAFGVNLYGNNVTTYVTVNGGGIFQMWSATKHFTNVTNQTSQAIGTTNAAGYIGGNWS